MIIRKDPSGGGLILIGQNRSFVGLQVYHIIAEPEVKAEIPPAARSIARAVGSALHG
jgi:hypothetical protein